MVLLFLMIGSYQQHQRLLQYVREPKGESISVHCYLYYLAKVVRITSILFVAENYFIRDLQSYNNCFYGLVIVFLILSSFQPPSKTIILKILIEKLLYWVTITGMWFYIYASLSSPEVDTEGLILLTYVLILIKYVWKWAEHLVLAKEKWYFLWILARKIFLPFSQLPHR